MGIDYSYEIFVRPERARDLLAAIAGISEPSDRTTTIELPDGSTFTGPWDYNFQAGATVGLSDTTHSLGMSLCFPGDELLREYVDEDPQSTKRLVAWPDGTTRFRVGYVYLQVDRSEPLPDHLCFSFTPATTRQSRVFLRSESVRSTFVDLCARAASPLCLFDFEYAYHLAVAAGGRLLPGRPFFYTLPATNDRDGFRAWLEHPTRDAPWLENEGGQHYGSMLGHLLEWSGVDSLD